MSSIPKTFSGSRFKKNPYDYYETPIDLAITCVNLLPYYTINTHNILDVGYGTGVWGLAARNTYPNSCIVGIELQDLDTPFGYSYGIKKSDFLTHNPSDLSLYDLIIGNPPYSSEKNTHLAEDFVLHSLDILTPTGYIAFLLKTEFKASARRYQNIFKNHAPLFEYQLVQRPNWTNYKKGSNTIEYSFFIWGKHVNTETTTKWLNWR